MKYKIADNRLSAWGSMQDFTSWGIHDLENGEETPHNYEGETVQWAQESRDHSNKSYYWQHTKLSWISPYQGSWQVLPAHVQAHLKSAKDRLDDPDEHC